MTKSASFFAVGLLAGVLVATAAFAAFLGGRGGSVAGPRVLKMAHGLEPAHPVHLGMVRMRERLEAISGGRMSLEIYASGVLGSEPVCLEQARNGTLALTKTSTAPLEAFIPEMQVFGLPYVFRDEAHFWQVLDGAIGEELLGTLKSRGLVGLCYYDSGSRSFYTVNKPIRTPDDLRGLKIRVQNSPVAIRMVEVFGGSATPIAFGELYSALAQGTVDGAENNAPSFVGNRHHEVCRYYTLNHHTRVPDVVLVSAKVWDALSSEEQGWLRQAARESALHQRALWAEATRKDLDAARARGVQVIEPDLAPFRRKAAVLLEDYRAGPVGRLAERIDAVR